MADSCFAQGTAPSQAHVLPEPTGQYSIGTSIFQFTDMARMQPLDPDPGHHREMVVQVWYPAGKNTPAPMIDYLPNAALFSAMEKEKYYDLSNEVIASWHEIKTHSALDVPILAKPQRFPLIIFSHGMGISRSNYTSFLENLASHGYIVAAIDHPYMGLTVLNDGRVLSSGADPRGQEVVVERVENMAQDASFILGTLLDGKAASGRFAGRIDVHRVGMMGHSLGGAAALEECRGDDRFKACVDMDGDTWGKVDKEGVNRPFLVLLNEPGEGHRPPPAMGNQRDDDWATVISKKGTECFVVKIQGTFHLSFTDFPFIVPNSLLVKNGADLPPHRAFEIMTSVINTFFAKYLNERSSTSFESSVGGFKEITVQSFNVRSQSVKP